MTTTGYDILRTEVLRLYDPSTAGTVEIRPMSEISDDDLERLVMSWSSRELRKAHASLLDQHRARAREERDDLRQLGKKATKDDNVALYRAYLRGDEERASAILTRLRGRALSTTERDQVHRQCIERSNRWTIAEHAGFAPPRDLDVDHTFATCVFNYLPSNLKRDHEAVAAVLRAWRTKQREPSPLGCHAVVDERARMDLDREYESSEMLDALHAVFAPLAGVFTGDKRTITALESIGCKSMMIRSHQLDEVASRLEKWNAAP